HHLSSSEAGEDGDQHRVEGDAHDEADGGDDDGVAHASRRRTSRSSPIPRLPLTRTTAPGRRGGRASSAARSASAAWATAAAGIAAATAAAATTSACSP